MNYFTGQLDLSLPIFQKKLSSLPDFSMDLIYTAGGGLKAHTPRTMVGLAWMLNYGGAVIRQKRGVPDDFLNAQSYAGGVPTEYNGILYNGGVTYHADGEDRIAYNDVAFDYEEGVADAQHDIFQFNLFGRSGKFYIGKDGTIQVVTDAKVRIVPTYGSAIPEFKLESFLIIDESGVKYFFNAPEFSIDGTLGTYDEEAIRYFGKEYASSWLLTKVEAPFGEDSIMYEYYHTGPASTAGAYTETYTKRSDEETGTGRITSNGLSAKALCPKSITFSDGSKVEFEYFGMEFYDLSTWNEYLPQLLLKRVNIYSSESTLVRKFDFSYHMFSGPNVISTNSFYDHEQATYSKDFWDARLHDISMVSNAGMKQSLYAFDYYLDQDLREGAVPSAGIDFWGYYNGKENESLILYPTQYQSSLPDRNPDVAYARLGSLKKIVYPTGGSEEFEYQLNDKKEGNVNVPVGGIRLWKRTMQDDADTTKKMVKEYRYVEEDGTTSSGFLGEKPEFTFVYNVYEEDGWPSNPVLKYTITSTYAYPVNPLSSIDGNPVGYRRVEEIYEGSGTNAGKVIYEYTDLAGVENWYPPDYYPYRPVDRPYWAVGLPKKITYMSSGGDKVKETINEYNIVEDLLVDNNYRSMQVSKKAEADLFQADGNMLRYLYKFSNYYPVIGRAELISTRENNYSSTAPTNYAYTAKVHSYDPQNFVRRTTSTDNSQGETILTKYFYPFDFDIYTPSGTPPHFTNVLKEKNILNVPLLTETWKSDAYDSYLLGSQATEFKEFQNGMFKPAALYDAYLSEPLFSSDPDSFNPATFLPAGRNYQRKFELNKYDEMGRLLEFEKEGEAKTSIILSKSGNVLAKGDNTSYDRFCFTGFEGGQTGNWTYSPAGIDDSDAFTGSNAYNGTVSKAGLPVGDYHISFWAKGNGSVTVNGISQAVETNWKWFELELANISSVTINSNGNLIDEVMCYPVEGSGISYSYRDGIGISTTTDPNGQVTYYEYDEFNRLRDIKDNFQNILKSYSYHYRAPLFYNTAQSGSFTPTCPSGYQPGPPVIYAIPAGTYLSVISQQDANAEAQSDVYFDGQDYADEHGVCNQIYYSAAVSGQFTKDDCPSGAMSFPVVYSVSANRYTSIISQADADAKAQNDLDTNGQDYANENGICRQYITVNIENYTGTTLEISFSPSAGTYTFPQGSGQLLVPEGTYTVQIYDPSGTGPSHTYCIGQRPCIENPFAEFSNVVISVVSDDIYITANN